MASKKKKLNLDLVDKNVDFDKAMEERTILNGVVMRTELFDIGTALIIQIDDKDIIVLKDQIGYMPTKKHLGDLVGLNMKVILTEKESEKVYYGSYIAACKILAEGTIERLKNGEAVMGIVRDIQPYGAFITISEQTYALMPNSGCVTGVGYAQDYLQRGQTLEVKLLRLNNDGKIFVEMVNKIETPSLTQNSIIEKAKLYKGQVLLAKVIKVNSKVAQVQLTEDIIGIAQTNPTLTLAENCNVRYQITRIKPDGTIMGRILAKI